MGQPVIAVIVLAGGASARLGTDKLALTRDGVSLLDTVLVGSRTALLGLDPSAWLIVVGPRAGSVPRDVVVTCEEPAGSGPVAALAAGLAWLDQEGNRPLDGLVAVLAADSPLGPAALPNLLGALDATIADGALLIDTTGRRQPLCAVYRRGPLAQALAALGDPIGRGMRDLLGHLTLIEVADTVGAADDIDTPDDAHRLGFTPSRSHD